MKSYIKIVPLSFGVLFLSIFLCAAIYAWSEPGVAPVGGNINAPINTGATSQTKIGPLVVGNTNWTQLQLSPAVNDTSNPVTGGTDRAHYHFSFLSTPAGKEPLIETNSDLWVIGASHNLTADGYVRTNTGFCIGSDCRTSWASFGGQWTTSGTNIYSNNTGNVGIGAAAPGYKLDVAGTIHTTGDILANGNYGLGLVGLYSATRYQNVFAMGAAYRLAADGTTPGNLYGIAWTHSNMGGQSIAGLGHQMLIMSNGVTTSAMGSGIWTSGNVTMASIKGIDQMIENTSGAYQHIGAWGVGRTDPTAVLVNTAYMADTADATDGYHLNQAVTSGANPQWGTTYTNNWFRSQNATGWYNESYGGGVWMDQSTYVRVYGGKGFTVDGSVGIGTQSPWTKLSVVGKSGFTRDGTTECCGNDATIGLGESTSSTGRKASISFHNGGVHEGTFELAGSGERRFVMRDNQGALMGLETTGNIRGLAFYYISDGRLKKDLTPIANSLDKLEKLNGVYFNWKDSDKPSMGLIAQDVEKVFPEAVSTNTENGMKSVDYGKMVAPLIEAVKSQQEKISTLEARIEKLESVTDSK